MKIFETTYDKLKILGIDVYSSSLRKLPYQGFMSNVYVASSNRGNLVIQIVRPIAEQRHLKVWKKFSGIWKLTKDVPGLPVAEFFLAEKINDDYVLVQQMLPGSRAGERIIRDQYLIDVWNVPFEKYGSQIENAVAGIHRIRIDGYGWFQTSGNAIKGTYGTWQEFLIQESSRWMKGIGTAESTLKYANDNLSKKMQRFIDTLPQPVYAGPASLIHGDIINPSNILIQNEKVSGVIDWEWSLAGDPAWEFAFLNKYSLAYYFKNFSITRAKEQKEFLERVELYEVLLLMLWTHVHSVSPRTKAYQVLRAHLRDALDSRL